MPMREVASPIAVIHVYTSRLWNSVAQMVSKPAASASRASATPSSMREARQTSDFLMARDCTPRIVRRSFQRIHLCSKNGTRGIPFHEEASVSSVSLCLAFRREPHRQMLDAADEGRPKALGRAVHLHVGEAPEQLLEHHLELQPGEARPEAEVLPDPERQVLIRGAPDVEHVPVRED